MFTAVLPPPDVVAELDAFLQPRREAEPRLRWTPSHQWHLTTAFMADVPDRSVDRLVETLAAAASRTPAFRLRLGGAGAFPWPIETKVLWLGVPEGGEQLSELAGRTRRAATTAGVRVDGARFVPHLTVARANRPIDSTRLVRVLENADLGGWQADGLVLIASHLRDRTNRYEVLERFALGGGDAGRPDDETATGGARAPLGWPDSAPDEGER